MVRRPSGALASERADSAGSAGSAPYERMGERRGGLQNPSDRSVLGGPDAPPFLTGMARAVNVAAVSKDVALGTSTAMSGLGAASGASEGGAASGSDRGAAPLSSADGMLRRPRRECVFAKVALRRVVESVAAYACYTRTQNLARKP